MRNRQYTSAIGVRAMAALIAAKTVYAATAQRTHEGGRVTVHSTGPAKRERQKYPSKVVRKRVGSGTALRNSWGAEWYYRQRENAERTQAQQLAAGLRNNAVIEDAFNG